MRDGKAGFVAVKGVAAVGRDDDLRCARSVGMFGTVNSHISYLSEVFVEWYISSHPRGIKDFLEKENLNGVFTEQQFEKLVLGKAYLDELLLQFVVESLPFRILPEKLSILNRFVKRANKAAEEIGAPDILPKKLSEICKSKKDSAAEKKHQIYERNKPEILAHRQTCYLEDPEKFRARSERYRKQNPEKVATYRHYYYVTHEKGRPVSPERRAYQQNYYLENYADISENAKRRYFAKTQCPVLSFLWGMRKQESPEAKSYKDLYKLFSKQCVAIKDRDSQLCGFAQSGNMERCSVSNNLNLPDLEVHIKQYLENLRQK